MDTFLNAYGIISIVSFFLVLAYGIYKNADLMQALIAAWFIGLFWPAILIAKGMSIFSAMKS